jgi:SAM-dependent methyltransferase
MTQKNLLISHNPSQEDVSFWLHQHAERIKKNGDKPDASVEQQLALLEQLNEFDFGRFLISNQGVNGYWTDYMLTHPWRGRKTGQNNRGEALNQIEDFILNKAPLMLATQQRLEIFLKENQKSVKNNAVLACIPCGMMGELLYLDYTGIKNIRLVGIDYDANTFEDAKRLAKEKNLSQFIELSQKDAWQLNIDQEFDLISSNGLNIYEPNTERVRKLFEQFYKALKNGGRLVSSFLTYPPHLTEQSEWDMNAIHLPHLKFQKILFADVLEAKFQCYQSSQEMKEQLLKIGFSKIDFIYDPARIFPTVVAVR